jgi:hypothetical protein
MRLARRCAALLVITACAAASAGEFVVAPPQIAARVRTLALRSCAARGEATLPPEVAARWEALIAEELRSAGVATLPSAEYAAAWRRVAELLGGAFDPHSGEPLEASWKAAREHAMRELQRTHAADAVLDCAAFESHRLPEPIQAGFLSVKYRAAGQLLANASGAPLRRVKYVRVLVVSIALHDRADSLLYSASAEVDWLALRNELDLLERPQAERLLPARDAAVRALVEPLGDAYRELARQAGTKEPG